MSGIEKIWQLFQRDLFNIRKKYGNNFNIKIKKTPVKIFGTRTVGFFSERTICVIK